MKQFLFLLVVVTQVQASPLSQKKAAVKKPFSMQVTETWTVNAVDGQAFSLLAEKTSLGPTQSVSYLNGDRELKNLPAAKNTWLNWRAQLVQMSERFPASLDCPHPIKFENLKVGSTVKSKSVCLEKLTQTERDSMQKLTKELSEFLYGK